MFKKEQREKRKFNHLEILCLLHKAKTSLHYYLKNHQWEIITRSIKPLKTNVLNFPNRSK